MSKTSKVVLFLAVAVLAGLTVGILRSLASTRATFAFVVPKAISNKLPTCIPSPGNCQWELWRVQRQAVTATWMSWDLYTRYRGQVYHAHGYRTGNATRWLWVIDGHELWLKAIKIYAKANPAQITQGPALLEDIRKSQSICDMVAPLIFVNVTNDAGRLVQPPEGSWPDGGAVSYCAGSYWLSRCRFGGSTPTAQADVDAGFGTDAVSAGSSTGIQQGVDESSWIAPDAATHRICSVPVGQACP